MSKILIFGNSGSGKSTLAKYLSESQGLAHLDLDGLAWKPTVPPERRALDDSMADIRRFTHANPKWVIEGCYTDLLELVKGESSEIIFMNLSIEQCIANAKNRPWEPHKYESKEAQDENLEMLIHWITQYGERNDTFSESAHRMFYDAYTGNKRVVVCNESYDM